MHALSKLSGQPTNARIITRNAVANVICSIIVGKRFEYDDDYFISFTTKMEVLVGTGVILKFSKLAVDRIRLVNSIALIH